MNRAQIVDLLTYCAACDQRTVGESDVAVWFDQLGPVDFDRALQATRTHYRRQPDVRLNPGHIWAMCRITTDANVNLALRQHCEHGTYCDHCKGVHQMVEPCTVLEPAPDNVRAITSVHRLALAKAIPVEAPVGGTTAGTVQAEPARRMEAERSRQLAALEAMGQTS